MIASFGSSCELVVFMAPAALSFDFDNTLLLSEACKHATMREVCSQFKGGVEVLETVPYDSRTAPPGVVVTRHTIFDGVARGLLARGEAPPAGVTECEFGPHLCAEFTRLLENRLLQAKEVPGATEVLRHLAEHNIPCFVNTATPQEPIDKLIDALGWRQYFRAVYGSPGTKLSNLQSIAATSGIAKAGGSLSAVDIVHVGDGDNDCKAAAEFGCRFIGIALPVHLGGSGAPNGGFTKPCVAVAGDMTSAAPTLCALLGIPSPLTGAPVTARVLQCRCMLDLGFKLSESSTSWPTCRPLGREVHKHPRNSQSPGARNKQSFTLNGGSGTHIDAPSHFIPGGRTVDQLSPSELAAVPLVVIDVVPPSPPVQGQRKRPRTGDTTDAAAASDDANTEAVAAREASNGDSVDGGFDDGFDVVVSHELEQMR